MKNPLIGIRGIHPLLQSVVASPVPGRWEKVERLQPGASMIVEMTRGGSLHSSLIAVEESFRPDCNRHGAWVDSDGLRRMWWLREPVWPES